MSTVVTSIPSHDTRPTLATADAAAALRQIEQRVLWLSMAMIHHANRIRPNPTGLKVGGHQASCASMVSIMTALWFEQLGPQDRVSVKPHASPVLHAINYLLGELDASYLTTLREFGGLQSYPSRSKDPDPVDYSTGSVGIGATPPIWGAIARAHIDTQLRGGAGRRGHRTDLGGDRAALHRHPVRRRSCRQYRGRPAGQAVLPSRGRRARRRRRVGGDSGPLRRRAGRDRVDRRPEPAVPGPGRAQHRRGPAGEHLRRRRMASDHAEVRGTAGVVVRPAGWACATYPDPRHAQRRVPATASVHRRRAPGAAARRGRRRRRDRVTDRWTRRRHPDPRDPQPGWS